MRRFRFSMDRILKLRKQQQRWTELQLSRHGAAVAAAQRQLDSLHEQLNRLGDSLEAELAGGVTTASGIDYFNYQKRLHAQMEFSHRQLEQAQRQYEQVRAEHVELKQRVEMLETLRANRHGEHRREQLKKEQQQLDALVAMRWNESRGIRKGNPDG